MGLFSDLLGAVTGAGGEGQNSPFITTFLRAGLNEGMSGNQMLGQLSQSGLGIRRQNFYQLLGEVRSSLSAGAWATGVDPNTMPSTDDIVEWSGGTAGKYLTRVNVYTREATGEGEYQIQRRGLSFLSNSPLTPAQAIQNATDLPTGMSGTPPRQILGYEYNGTYHQS